MVHSVRCYSDESKPTTGSCLHSCFAVWAPGGESCGLSMAHQKRQPKDKHNKRNLSWSWRVWRSKQTGEDVDAR